MTGALVFTFFWAVIATLALVYTRGKSAMLSRKLSAANRQLESSASRCSCGHTFAFHGDSGKCHHVTNRTASASVRCGCQRYDGPPSPWA